MNNSYSVQFLKREIDGYLYFVPIYAQHRPAAQAVLSGRYWEPETHNLVKLIFRMATGGSIIHAGAFFGDMLPAFSQYATNVYAFEPVLENYVLARMCVEANSLSNVILMNSALSDVLTNLRINTSDNDKKHLGGASHIHERGFICSSLKIDNLMIKDLFAIHLDVEGHELSALRGADQTIQEHHPFLLLEDNMNQAAKYLHNMDYEHFLTLPHLKVWAHKSRSKFTSDILKHYPQIK